MSEAGGGDLCHSIRNLCQDDDLSLDAALESSQSILGKLHRLFASLKDPESQLLSATVFEEFLRKKTEGIRFDEKRNNPINFIQFVQRIESVAKENGISKEYLYQKVRFRKRIFRKRVSFPPSFYARHSSTISKIGVTMPGKCPR